MATDVSPDVVVMDVTMSKKDGVEACREIMESAPDTRVLMLAASSEEDAVVEAIAAGATGYPPEEDGQRATTVSRAGRGLGGTSSAP